METINEAKEYIIQKVRKIIDTGKNIECFCPCCNKKMVVKKIVFSRNFATYLKGFSDRAKTHLDEWVSNREVDEMGGRQNGDYANLRFWGLIENSGVGRGNWRLTKKGRDFIEGTITIKNRITLLNGVPISQGGETITFEDAMIEAGKPSPFSLRREIKRHER